MICSSLPSGWESTAPRPSVLASIYKTSGLVQSGQSNTGAVVSFCFSSSKDSWWASVHSHLALFFRSLWSGAERRAASLMKRRYQEMRPKNRRASLRFLDSPRFWMVATLSGSVCSPILSTTCPGYFSSGLKNWQFSGFGLRLASCSFWKTLLRTSMCSPNVWVYTNILSSR